MQRDRLICCLVGKFTALEPTILADDLRIKIDQHLSKCNFPPIGTTAEDLEIMDELLDEIAFSTIAAGVNRKSRRSN